jgi:hypothetical protein
LNPRSIHTSQSVSVSVVQGALAVSCGGKTYASVTELRIEKDEVHFVTKEDEKLVARGGQVVAASRSRVVHEIERYFGAEAEAIVIKRI